MYQELYIHKRICMITVISLFQLHISRRQLKKIMVNILRFNQNILLALCNQETFYIYPVLKVATVSAKKSAFFQKLFGFSNGSHEHSGI